MVPTLVPVLSEMKQEAMKRLLRTKFGGTAVRARLIVASMAPISFAEAAKAPARMNIHSICMTPDDDAPSASRPKRSLMDKPCMMSRLYMQAARKAIVMGTA